MSKKEIRQVIILDMDYEVQTNLFRMRVKDVQTQKEVVFGINGKDFGINPSFPPDMIKYFCEQWKGKTKNLHLEIDNTTLESHKKNDEKIKEEDIKKIYDNVDNYPIDQIMNTLYLEEEQQ